MHPTTRPPQRRSCIQGCSDCVFHHPFTITLTLVAFLLWLPQLGQTAIAVAAGQPPQLGFLALTTLMLLLAQIAPRLVPVLWTRWIMRPRRIQEESTDVYHPPHSHHPPPPARPAKPEGGGDDEDQAEEETRGSITIHAEYALGLIMEAALAAQAVAPGTGQDVGYDPAELAHRLRLDILPVLDFLESQDQLPAIFQPEVAKESLMADHRLSLLPFYRGWGTYNEMEAFHLRLVLQIEHLFAILAS